MIAVPQDLTDGETLALRDSPRCAKTASRGSCSGGRSNLRLDELAADADDARRARRSTSSSTVSRPATTTRSAFAIRWKRPSLAAAVGARVYVERRRHDDRDDDVAAARRQVVTVDGAPWRRIGFVNRLACEDCGITYPEPEPRLFSFNSPLGACPECEGFGNVIDIDMELVVPDPQKSLQGRGRRAVEHAGLRARAERTAGAGQRLSTCRSTCRSRSSTPEQLQHRRRRRAGARVRRPERLLRLAGEEEVQDAHPRVPEPLAKLSRVPDVPWSAAPARAAGLAHRRPEHRRDHGAEGRPTPRRFFRELELSEYERGRRPHDARASAVAARLSRSKSASAI